MIGSDKQEVLKKREQTQRDASHREAASHQQLEATDRGSHPDFFYSVLLPEWSVEERNLSNPRKVYEYTWQAVSGLIDIVESLPFEEADSDTIFHYLSEQMEIISFADYLKRYIYEKTKPAMPFEEVTDAYYVSLIRDSFDQHHAPHSFTPVRSRWSTIIQRWLTSRTVERETVFLLGFGLGMTDAEVSVFLMKVLKEHDFDFSEPKETVYWHCFHHGLRYADAVRLLGGDNRDGKDNPCEAETQKAADRSDECTFWRSVQSQLRVYLSNPEMLQDYLRYLANAQSTLEHDVFTEFRNVFLRASDATRIVMKESRNEEKKHAKDETTGAFDIENVLYSGVPRTRDRNLLPMDRSALVECFGKKRLGRQRLGRLLHGTIPPERFDLLTLLFLDYTNREPASTPDGRRQRLQLFILEANEILKRCHMWVLYPVNPYESFLLMCLLTEDPLCTYNDVWENSYGR